MKLDWMGLSSLTVDAALDDGGWDPSGLSASRLVPLMGDCGSSLHLTVSSIPSCLVLSDGIPAATFKYPLLGSLASRGISKAGGRRTDTSPSEERMDDLIKTTAWIVYRTGLRLGAD